MLLYELREKVIEIAKKARYDRLVPLTMGNFSARDKESGLFCITPSGMDYDKLTPFDIVVMDPNMNIVEGDKKPSIEASMHCLTYNKRQDINGVVHTHSTYATAWACCHKSIPAVVAELAGLIGGDVECAPYKPMGTVELAQTVVLALKDKHAVLLANHGVLAVGYDIETAYSNAFIVEEGAKVAFLASNIGKFNVIPEDECVALRKWILQKYGQ